jgi:hypothetical protein
MPSKSTARDFEKKNGRPAFGYPFVASAELIDEKSEIHVSTRTSQLSLFGCMCDGTDAFPPDARLVIKIVSGMSFFEARGSVARSEDTGGTSIAFQRVHPYFLKILRQWLTEAARQARARDKSNRSNSACADAKRR